VSSVGHSRDYSRYIGSLDWEFRRKEYLLLVADFKCERCQAEQTGDLRLEVHHVRYDNLGAEPDDDLEALCPDCHRRADRQRKRQTARRNWNARRDAWAEKVFGNRWDEVDEDEIDDAFSEWLEGHAP
jgi:5-methylcytosine-specific restriction endonuclease McrA